MEVTILGFYLLPVGILSILFFPKKLVSFTTFFIPFTATSLVNFNSGVPLTPFQFFGALFIFHQIFKFSSGKINKLHKYDDYSISLLILFMLIVCASMIMPLLIDGDFIISSNDINNFFYFPVILNIHNIKYPLPVIFGIFFSIALVYNVENIKNYISIIKYYIAGSIFTSIWGLYQFFCSYILDIEYPYYIFNNSTLEAAKGYSQQLYIDGELFNRISSVAHEPSILVKYLVTTIPVLLISILLKNILFTRTFDSIYLLLSLLVMILAFSTAGYFGLILIFLLTYFGLIYFKQNFIVKLKQILLFFISFIIILHFFDLPLSNIFDFLIFQKSDSGSASDRFLSITNSWQYFLEYPILGIGWNISTSHDLIVKLLVSTGLVGFFTFFIFIFYLILNTTKNLNFFVNRYSKNIMPPLWYLTFSLLISFMALIILGIFTGVEFYLGYFYFLVGILISSNRLLKNYLMADKRY